MSVLILDNKRIFLEGICRYELNSDKLYYRNDNEEERFLFFLWLMNEDELWSKYSFKYLYIKMFDGKSYKFFSDQRLHFLMKEMVNYFKGKGIVFEDDGIEFDEEILEEDEHLKKALESYVSIKDTYKFIKEDISYIASKLDCVFGTI